MNIYGTLRVVGDSNIIRYSLDQVGKFVKYDICPYIYTICRYMGIKSSDQIVEQDTILSWLNVKQSSIEQANSSFTYMRVIKGGLKSESINSFIKHSGLSQKQVSQIIHISERTIQRNSPDKPINISTSEKLVELARFFYKGVEVFNEKPKFITWLNRPNKSLKSQKPIDLIETSFGLDLVYDELLKIEYGVFS